VEVTVKKLRKPAIVYKIALLENSELAGREIVSVASVAKCWRQNGNAFAGICNQSTFHLHRNM